LKGGSIFELGTNVLCELWFIIDRFQMREIGQKRTMIGGSEVAKCFKEGGGVEKGHLDAIGLP
jgi:hypothetical protein